MKTYKYFCVRCLTKVSVCNEHRKPRSLGGSDNEGNIQPMCHTCHTWKHNHPEEAREQGFTIPANMPERNWWLDFPYSRV